MSTDENKFQRGEWFEGQFYPDESDPEELPAPARQRIPDADLQLLELAARALGARFEEIDGEGYGNLHFPVGSAVNAWNPLQFSGDALELAVRLRIDVEWEPGDFVSVAGGWSDAVGDDPVSTTRRAVTRAAAEIGKTK